MSKQTLKEELETIISIYGDEKFIVERVRSNPRSKTKEYWIKLKLTDQDTLTLKLPIVSNDSSSYIPTVIQSGRQGKHLTREVLLTIQAQIQSIYDSDSDAKLYEVLQWFLFFLFF